MLQSRLFRWVFYGHVWIALAATSLSWISLRIAFGDDRWANEAPLLLFIFTATLGIYTLHRYLSFQRAGVRPNSVRYDIVARHPAWSVGIGVTSLLIAGFLWIRFLIASWWALLGAIPLTIFYLTPPIPGWRRLRDLPYLKNLWVAWAWTLMTVVVPVTAVADIINDNYLKSGMIMVSNPSSINPAYTLEIIVRFLFTGCIALLFDLRDVTLDRSQNVKTIAAEKPKLHRVLVYGSLVCCALISFLLISKFSQPNRIGFLTGTCYLLMLPAAYYTYHKTSEDWFAVVVNGLLLLPYLALLIGL
ncbi:MAG: hypothetical protein AAF840_01510 [Bacteroidota bacterium]